MYASGNTSISLRQVLDGGWHLLIRCGNPDCRRSVGPALRMQPWPRYYDMLLIDLYGRLRCSNLVKRNGRLVKCGARSVELEVKRMTGKGSQMEVVLRLADRME
jgi:hypothetical protein